MHEAILYKKIDNPPAGGKKVQCEVCNHFCIIAPGQRGVCGVRENKDGKLFALNYGKAIAAHIDPIEKKPLYHFMSGTLTYSIATVGCNLKCLHCQNADISQYTKEWSGEIIGDELLPEQVIKNAIKNNYPSISYTYTEPTIFLEYALDTMKLSHKKGLKNIWVSNGYMSEKTLDLILPYLDAINVDLKSFSNEFYNRICGAKLQPVLDNLIKIKTRRFGGHKTHLEVTTLIIPNENDSIQELKQIAEFIVKQLGPGTPWHISAFHPSYKMLDHQSTPREKIFEAVAIGKQKGIERVYAGNI